MQASEIKIQLAKIREAGKARDYKLAIQLCSKLLAQTDQCSEALLYLGRSYHALKLYDQALYVFRFFCSRKPDSLLGNFFLGRTYAALGLFKEAIPPLERVLKKQPHFTPALSFLGIAYLKLRRADLAVNCFEQALQLEPANQKLQNAYYNALLVQGIRLFYKKDLEHAARIFEFLVSQQKDNIIPVLYLAVIAREFSNFDYALYYYDQALRISPSDSVFHLHKAYLLFQLGREKEALDELTQVQNLVPADLKTFKRPEAILRLIAIIHFRNKRYREAIYFGKQALKQNYHDPDMHLLLAESYYFFDDLYKAKNHYLRAKEDAPERPEIFYGLAMVLWEKGDLHELLALTASWERINPSDQYIKYFKTLSLCELGSDATALIPDLQQLIHQFGPDPNLMLNLGRCYLLIGRAELAENWLLRTLKLIHDNYEAFLLLCQVYEKLNRLEDQLAVLKKIVTLFPTEIAQLKKYARLLLQHKRYQEAVLPLERLVTLLPENETYKRNLGLVYLKARHYQSALVVFKELIFKNPTSVYYLRQFIYCVVKLNNISQAILILEKATRFLPNEPDLLLPLGVLYARRKEFEKSASSLRAALAINPYDWRAYYNLACLYQRMGQRDMAATFRKRAQEYKNIDQKSSQVSSQSRRGKNP